MKALVALGMLLLALSFCNLLGKRNGNNSNSNSPPSGTSSETAENSNTPAPQASPAADEAAPPPPSQRNTSSNKNSNMAAPPNVSAGPPGVRSLPSMNQNTATNAPRAPRTISGGVLNGKAIRLVQPPYPAIARAAHASGQVTVQVLIDENGNVTSASAVSGHPLLKPSAVAAARASKFSPTMLSGQPVKVTGVIVYNFVAQ